MAKIHTLEWTCAIVPNPIIVRGMHVNWSGLVGEDKQDVLAFLNDSDVLGGIIGSHHDHHSAPYAFTEEFVAVYRMHPLMPDDLTFSSLLTGRALETRQLAEVTGRNTPSIAERITMSDLFYSFGTSHPGAVTLHNYPRTLQNLRRDDGEHLDLAAVDIFRDRERGVPRYNQFRRLMHKDPVKSFDELTDNPAWRKQIKAVYNGDLEKVDLMTGLYAEPLPPGFGFSETAFRVFILMASRRLKSDRFFTDDYGPEIYTEFGVDYIKKNSMLTVLKRHFPQLAPALSGVENAFAPWKATKGPADVSEASVGLTALPRTPCDVSHRLTSSTRPPARACNGSPSGEQRRRLDDQYRTAACRRNGGSGGSGADGRLHRVSEDSQRTSVPDRRRAAVQPGEGCRVRARRVHRAGWPSEGAPGRSLF